MEDQRLKAQASALQSHRDQQLGVQKEQNRLALLGLQQTGEHREGLRDIQEEQNRLALIGLHQGRAVNQATLNINQQNADTRRMQADNALFSSMSSSSKKGSGSGGSRFKTELSEGTHAALQGKVGRIIEGTKGKYPRPWYWFNKNIPMDHRNSATRQFSNELRSELIEENIPEADMTAYMSAAFDAYYWPEFKDRLLDAIPGDATEQTIREHRRLWMGDSFNPTSTTSEMDAETEKNIKLGQERRPNEQGAPTLTNDTSATLPTTPPTNANPVLGWGPFRWEEDTWNNIWDKITKPPTNDRRDSVNEAGRSMFGPIYQGTNKLRDSAEAASIPIRGIEGTTRDDTPPVLLSPTQQSQLQQGYNTPTPAPDIQTFLSLSATEQIQLLNSLDDQQRQALMFQLAMYRRNNPSSVHTLPSIPLQ